MKIILVILFLTLSCLSESADLELETLEGRTDSLAHYKGRIVVLNFWATWCIPCREEMPDFVRLQSRYVSRGVQFLAASIDVPEDRSKIDDFVREFHLNFPVWIEATLEQQASFGLGTAVPATAIFDRSGNLRFRIIGQSNPKDLEKRIRFLLTGADSEPDALLLPMGMTKEHFEQHHARPGSHDDHHHEEAGSAGSEVPS